MPFGLILDIVVAVLLVVTICYAVMLNRRLAKLRRDKRELTTLARTFGDATMRADASIGTLKTMTDALDQRLGKAEQLRDDLVFLVERGGTTADRLEQLVRQARDDIGVVPQPRAADAAPPVSAPAGRRVGIETRDDAAAATAAAGGDAPRSEAERALLKALRSAG